MNDVTMNDEKMSGKFLSLIGFTLIVSSFIAHPLHASPQDDLKHAQAAMQQSKARQARLAEQKKTTEDELKGLQQQLTELAAKLQDTETAITASEDRQRILGEQIQARSDALKKRRKDLAVLVQAALHLSRLPPEAMVMMPGDVRQTMTAARALKLASDSIKEETRSIGQQMDELNQMKDKEAQEHEALMQQKAALDKQRQALDARLAERRALLDTLGRQTQEEARRQAKLAKKTASLQQLIASLDREQADEADSLRPDERAADAEANKKMRSFLGAKGHVRVPAAGHVVQAFGVSRDGNETSKGIVIAARSKAHVVAPFDGEVLFCGPFLHYGRMIILRHSDGFHSLIAGLAKIDVQPGQFLLEGEPIGAMGEDDSNRLYVELRKNNKPVDPAPWMNLK